MATWDAAQYERFADERNRPFYELVSRIDASPSLVVDLGCGNGPLTLSLTGRWPNARIVGVDSSAEMLTRATALDTDSRVEWVHADAATWDVTSTGRPDVIITNATLQWIPQHRSLLPVWMAALAEGGTFAMQVPGNFDAPSHRLIREVAQDQPRGDELAKLLRHGDAVSDPRDYVEILAPHSARVDAWETTYLQILDPAREQQFPVLEWVKGTALRPLLSVLDAAEQERFLRELGEALRAAYPTRAYGTPFEFRRIFAVATAR